MRGDNLDISWLKDENADSDESKREEPAFIARLALREMSAAIIELRDLLKELGEDPDHSLDEIFFENDGSAREILDE